MIIQIPFTHLKSMSSDLLRGEVKISFTFALNANTMLLREKLAMLEVLGTPVDLDIKSPQGMLAGFQSPLPDSEHNISEDGGETLDTATGELKSPAEKVFDLIEPKLRGEKKPGGIESITFSTPGKSVTVTGEQFSKAAQRIEAEGRAVQAHGKKSKNKGARK